MGLVFFFFFIVTDVLSLQMASSRPVPEVAEEAHSLTAAQLMGRSSPSSISEGARAPRHSTIFFSVSMVVKKKKTENDEQAP